MNSKLRSFASRLPELRITPLQPPKPKTQTQQPRNDEITIAFFFPRSHQPLTIRATRDPKAVLRAQPFRCWSSRGMEWRTLSASVLLLRRACSFFTLSSWFSEWDALCDSFSPVSVASQDDSVNCGLWAKIAPASCHLKRFGIIISAFIAPEIGEESREGRWRNLCQDIDLISFSFLQTMKRLARNHKSTFIFMDTAFDNAAHSSRIGSKDEKTRISNLRSASPRIMGNREKRWNSFTLRHCWRWR